MERSGGHKAFQGLGEGAGAGAGREEMELLTPVQEAVVPDSCGEGKGRVWPTYLRAACPRALGGAVALRKVNFGLELFC